jgi:hypothetical protein
MYARIVEKQLHLFHEIGCRVHTRPDLEGLLLQFCVSGALAACL